MHTCATCKHTFTLDGSVIGKRVRVIRTVTAKRPTREWTGVRVWEGIITDHALMDVSTGELAGVCVKTDSEHTWLALGIQPDLNRSWVTEIEFLDACQSDCS